MGTTEGLMGEHFVQVVDFPEYEVSNYGRVLRTDSGHELKHILDSNGYPYVNLYAKGVRKQAQIKRLVAQAFFADYQAKSGVYLISDNKTDCSVRNITLQKPNTSHPGRKVLIVETGVEYNNPTEAAHAIGGSVGTVVKVLMGMGKQHKGYTFQWANRHSDTHGDTSGDSQAM